MQFNKLPVYLLGTEGIKIIRGEYTKWPNLVKHIKISQLLVLLIVSSICLLSISSIYLKSVVIAYFNTNPVSGQESVTSLFNNLTWWNIYNSNYLGIPSHANTTQDMLVMFAIYVLVIKSIFFLFTLLGFVYLWKIRQAYSFYIRRRMPKVDLITRSKIPFLSLDIAINPFPISTYMNIRKWGLPDRIRVFSVEGIMNLVLEKQKFPKFPGNKSFTLIQTKELSFMYHGDNEWDKWVHKFLKRFFPYLYKKHLLSANTRNKREEVEKEDPVVLKNISLTINSGKFTTILGCNGSSKSTLLKTIINLFEKYNGRIIWLRKDLKDISIKSFYKNVAYVAQESIVHNEISVYDYVACGLFPSFKFFKFNYPKNDPVILSNLEKMEILQYKDKNIKNLSGGERQKAILARVLTQQTKVIILDEPTTYLDINNQYKILNLLKKLQLEENKTIIAILHDIKQAEQFSDEVILLDDGRVFAYGPTEQIINKNNIERVFGVPWN